MELMQKARAQMAVKHVFFASLVLSTKCVENKSIPTACTDMTRIEYNPEFIEGLKDIKLVMFVVAHEVMHIALKHGLRRGYRDPELANIAMDFAVNIMLKKAGFTIWEHAYLDEFDGQKVDFDNMSFEQIYDELLKKVKKSGGGGKGDKGKGNQGGMSGDVLEPGSMTQEDRAKIEQQISQQVAQAASMARMQGSMSADLARLVDGILNPPLPWQQVLAEFMYQSCTCTDETWGRRDRRFPETYLPGRYSETMGEITIIGDTSGSMPNQIFAQVGAEIDGMMDMVKPERVRVVWADDTDCALEEIFEAGEPVTLNPKGFGGTDMRKPLRFVEQYDPRVVILITDGYTPWPDVSPDFPLIILCSTEAACPEWARVVRWNQGN